MTPMTDSPAIPPAATDIKADDDAAEGRSRPATNEITPPIHTENDNENGESAAIPMAAGEGMNRPQRPRDNVAKITPNAKPTAPASGAWRGMEDNPFCTASAVAFQVSAEGDGMASVPRP